MDCVRVPSPKKRTPSASYRQSRRWRRNDVLPGPALGVVNLVDVADAHGCIRFFCFSSFTTSRPRISPFRQRRAAAVRTPSGAARSHHCVDASAGTAAAMPAEIAIANQPDARARPRISAMSFFVPGRSRTTTTRSSTPRCSLRAMAFRLLLGDASRSTAPRAAGRR